MKSEVKIAKSPDVVYKSLSKDLQKVFSPITVRKWPCTSIIKFYLSLAEACCEPAMLKECSPRRSVTTRSRRKTMESKSSSGSSGYLSRSVCFFVSFRPWLASVEPTLIMQPDADILS